MTPDALKIIQGDCDDDTVPDVEPIDAPDEATGGAKPGILEPITVAFKGRVTDPRNIDTVIGQTRAMLDAPEAEALRRHMRREKALQQRELEQQARAAERAAQIDERNRKLLHELAERKSQASASATQSPVAQGSPSADGSAASPSSRSAAAIDASVLPVPVATDESDAYSRLRVEEARVRLEAARRAGGGDSIIATYVAEDVRLQGEALARKAEQLARYPPTPAQGRTPEPLHQRIAARRESARKAEAEGARRLGLTHIDEDEAERRAAEKAAARIEGLRGAADTVATSVSSLRHLEAEEAAEQQRRFRHQNEERQRVLDETKALHRAQQRKDRLREEFAASKAAASGVDTSASLATGSVIRARPMGGGTSALLYGEAAEDEKVLAANLRRQETAEHPIDAYQRRVRADLLADRGYDDDTIAAIEADMRDTTLLRLAAAHDR